MWRRSLFVFGLTLAVSTPGWAQDAAPSPDPAPAEAAPNPADLAEARKAKAAADALLNDPDGERLEEARPLLKKAYELSGSLNALYNLGLCEYKLELYGDAIKSYETYLKKSPADDSRRASIESDLKGLNGSVVWVTMSSDRPEATVTDTRTTRDGKTVTNHYRVGLTPKRVGLKAGSHQFVAKSSGYPERKWDALLSAAAPKNHEFVFDKDAPVTAEGFGPDDKINPKPVGGDTADVSRPIPVYAWVAGGVTVAAAIGAGVMMGVAGGQKSDYDDNLRGKAPLTEQQDAVSSIETSNLVADVLLGVTAAGAVTTLVLILTRPEVEDTPSTGLTWTVTPFVGFGSGGISAQGRF